MVNFLFPIVLLILVRVGKSFENDVSINLASFITPVRRGSIDILARGTAIQNVTEGIEITINNIDYNYENNGEKDNKKGFDGNPFMASPVAILSNTNVCALTNDNDEILEWLESNKEKLVSF
ncbi:14817_t:CDS:2, partial [Entrophospora sp. SA101]